MPVDTTVHTYVVGDIHMRDCNAAGPFMQFLQRLHDQHEPARLIILGDLCEYWLETERYLRQYAPMLAALRALAEKGWRLDLVLGNREFSIGERLLGAARLIPHWPHLDVQIAKVKIRILHGDRLCHDPSYHMMAAVLRGFWVRIMYRMIPAWVQNFIVRVTRSVSKGSDRNENLYEKRVFVDPRRIAAHKRSVDTLIAGHVHDTWHKHVRGVDVYLVGDWPLSRGNWIEIDADGNIKQCSENFID